MKLLPEQPAYVSLIDPDDQDDLRIREAIGRLEAFTLAGKKGVYVNLHGPTLERALGTRDEGIYRFDIHVLAAMVWHEMAHLVGADEAEAQAREEGYGRNSCAMDASTRTRACARCRSTLRVAHDDDRPDTGLRLGFSPSPSKSWRSGDLLLRGPGPDAPHDAIRNSQEEELSIVSQPLSQTDLRRVVHTARRAAADHD